MLETSQELLTVASDTETLQADIKEINDSLRRRASNNRDNVTQALRGGRHATSLKARVKAEDLGNWETWVVENTDYDSARQAQNDMQFWRAWKDRIDELIEVGVINDLDNPESQLVGTLDDNAVTISLSAMEEFKRKGVPDSALEYALDALRKGPVSIHDAQAIVQTAKAIEALPQEFRAMAEGLYHEHGLSNPQVIAMIPQMAEQPGMLREIESTDHIYVPGLDRQVPIAQAGASDIEIALGRYGIEEELEAQAKAHDIREDRLDRSKRFNYDDKIEGTLQQILFSLNKKPTDRIYSVVVYSREVL